MAGLGEIAEAPAGYPPNNGKVWMVKSGQWQELAEPTSADVNGGVGPAGLFAWYAQQEFGDGREVAVINAARGGRRSDEWLPGGTLYTTALQAVLGALSLPGAVFRGFIHYDGANDAAMSAETEPDWIGNWTTTEAAFRADIGARATGKPWLYTRLANVVPTDMPYPWWASIQAQQDAWESANRLMDQAPPGPFREEYKLHLKTAGSAAVAQNKVANWRSHPTYG